MSGSDMSSARCLCACPAETATYTGTVYDTTATPGQLRNGVQRPCAHLTARHLVERCTSAFEPFAKHAAACLLTSCTDRTGSAARPRTFWSTATTELTILSANVRTIGRAAAHPYRGMTSISISCSGTGSSERLPGSSRRPDALPAMAPVERRRSSMTSLRGYAAPPVGPVCAPSRGRDAMCRLFCDAAAASRYWPPPAARSRRYVSRVGGALGRGLWGVTTREAAR